MQTSIFIFDYVQMVRSPTFQVYVTFSEQFIEVAKKAQSIVKYFTLFTQCSKHLRKAGKHTKMKTLF